MTLVGLTPWVVLVGLGAGYSLFLYIALDFYRLAAKIHAALDERRRSLEQIERERDKWRKLDEEI